MPYDTESKSRNASCVPFRGRGPRSGEGVDGGKNDYDILILCLIPPKGETTHYILRVAPLLQPLLLLTHWIFRSLMLPYKSSSLVQNGFAVHRFAQGPLIGGQDRDGPSILSVLCPVHPFASSRFPSRGNEKYGEEKQRVIYFMYHSAVSLFGGERSELITRMRIMPYDTESQFP